MPNDDTAAEQTLQRSSLLMSREDTALLVIDVQQKLMPLLVDAPSIIWNIERLLEGSKLLGVPVLATEQYPKGVGATVPEIAKHLPSKPLEKLTFSCFGCKEFADNLENDVFAYSEDDEAIMYADELDLD